jgi:hypothetical protein
MSLTFVNLFPSVVFSFFFSPLPVDVPLPTTPSYFKTFPNYPGANIADQSKLPSEPKNLHAAIVSKQFVTLKWNVPEKTKKKEKTT